jgi:hypothetical protein
MTQIGQIFLAVAGFLLLAASLVVKKKAGWAGLVGTAVLTFLAVRESDPTLALGALALIAARYIRPPRKDPPAVDVAGQTDGCSGPSPAPRNRP